jgi:hypothetical protein
VVEVQALPVEPPPAARKKAAVDPYGLASARPRSPAIKGSLPQALPGVSHKPLPRGELLNPY